MATLDRKIAFITGGNRGIGFETARQLAKLGILPVIGSRNGVAGKHAADVLGEEGLKADSFAFDVKVPADRLATVEIFTHSYGRLDILINNAGTHLEGEPAVEHLYTASTTPEQVLRDTMETNFFSAVTLTDLLLPLLRKAPAGRIVNTSTILASLTLMADPRSAIYQMKSLAYDTSKVALNSYTIHLAHELADTAVKVNSAHPGWVQTDMGGRMAMIDVIEGAKTGVTLATLPSDGPNGGFFHLGEPLPW